MAATSEELTRQAHQLQQSISFFKLDQATKAAGTATTEEDMVQPKSVGLPEPGVDETGNGNGSHGNGHDAEAGELYAVGAGDSDDEIDELDSEFQRS